MKNKYLVGITVILVFLMSTTLPSAVLAAEPIEGGTLTTPMGSEALTLNPFTWGSIYESYIIGHVYDALVQYDVNNQPVPVLAESYSYNSTYELWTFNLRDEAYWTDGEKVTTEDVEYTWTLLWEDENIPRRSWLFDSINAINVINDTQIQVEFTWGPKPADVLIDFATTWIVPKHIWQNVDDIYTFTNDEPIGCGPFILEEWAHGQFFRFSANKNYYLDGPYVDEKIVRIIREVEAGYYALSIGDIELLGAPPPELEAVAKNDPNIAIHEYLQDYIMYLGMNQRRYPNNVTEFRHAVLYGINRSEIIDIAGYGRGLVAPASMSLPYGPYYNPDIPQYPYNPDKANEILDNLGWVDTDDDGIREDDKGDPLAFDLLVTAEAQESVDTAKLIAKYMEDLGIDITVQPVVWDVLWSAVGGPGGDYEGKYDYDWAFLGWVGFWSDRHPNWAAWMFNEDLWWGSDNVNIPGWSGYNRSLVTNLTTQIMYETDEVKVKQMLDQVQEIIAYELPYLPIRILGGVTLYRVDEFTGWVMGNTTGPDNWQSWLSVHLIESPKGTPGFEFIGAFIAITITVGLVKLKRKR